MPARQHCDWQVVSKRIPSKQEIMSNFLRKYCPRQACRYSMKTKAPIVTVSPWFPLRLAPVLVLAILIACCPLQTRADTIALGFTGGALGARGANATVGWAFTLSSPVLVTQLGLWDFVNNGLGTS